MPPAHFANGDFIAACPTLFVSNTSSTASMSAPAPTVDSIPASHEPIKAALLGGGLFATNSYVPSLALLPGLSVSTIWSRSPESASKLAAKAKETGLPNSPSPEVKSGPDGLDAILADDSIRAIIMVLPLGVQPELIRRAWKAGKHVISEKPVGRDVEQASQLVEEYEREWAPKGLVWRVAESESPLHGLVCAPYFS